MTRPMMNPESKRALKGMVLSLRELLEGEFDPDTYDPVHPGGDVVRQLARLGIDPNRPASLNSDAAPSYLSAEEKTIRDRICAAIRRQASLFGDPSQVKPLKRGFRAYVRETTYTWINRLLGLKCMEVRGLLRDAHGEPDFVVTPSEQYGGLPRRAWRIKGQDPVKWQQARVHDLLCAAIADACTRLTRDIGILFDPESPHALIWPSPQALTTLLQKIQGLEAVPSPLKGEGQGGGGPYASHDFLGWVYQYFQTKEKDQVFEAASKKKRKIEKDDIIPATQIYTEEYMVAYLVQNTVGRLWMEMHPDSNLAGNWDYYVKPPEGNPPVEREAKKAIDLKLMDPALGGGHFHLAGFDLLFEMYLEEMENAGKPGWPEAPSVASRSEIPRAIIEHNLYGIDIDARAVQIATLALYLKAREASYDGPIKAFHFVVANAAPFDSPSWHEFIKTVHDKGSFSAARVLAALGKQLKNLDEFGSLLRIEEDLQKVIREEANQWTYRKGGGGEAGVLFPEMARPRQQRLSFEKEITDETYFDETLSPSVEKELDDFYRSARQKGLAEAAILASDADRGFDFLRLCMERYDVVYTNPPYMGSKNMGKELKDFVARAYPEGKRDLYAAFILRCLELAEPNGYVGMVTQQSWMFLSSFSDMRELLLRNTILQAVCHLGPKTFKELSNTNALGFTLFVVENKKPKAENTSVFFRLVHRENKLAALTAATGAYREKMHSIVDGVYLREQSIFAFIPGSSLFYWSPDSMLKLFENGSTFATLINAKQGLITGDNDRFLRYFWEVFPKQETKWIPYMKGGPFSRWFGNQYYVVNWEKDGKEIRSLKSPDGKLLSRPQNTQFYLRSGGTWTSQSSYGFATRLMPKGFIFDAKGPAFFADDLPTLNIALGLTNSLLIQFIFSSIQPTVDYGEGYLLSLPMPENFSKEFTSTLTILVEAAIDLKRRTIRFDVTEREFTTDLVHSYNCDGLRARALKDIHLCEAQDALRHFFEGRICQLTAHSYGLSAEDYEIVAFETGEPPGSFPMIEGYESTHEIAENLGIGQRLADVEKHEIDLLTLTPEQFSTLSRRISSFYEGGWCSHVEQVVVQTSKSSDRNEMKDDTVAATRFPSETSIEEISLDVKINPISVHLALQEMRDKGTVKCESGVKRHAEDYVSVMIIRMLGYQWPKQVEAGESPPEWVDADGIIPLEEGMGEPTLLDRVRERFGADFGVEKEASIEAEFGNIVGKPLARWLEEDFFGRHVKQFKSRPIAWHIVSDPSVVEASLGPSGKGRRKKTRKKRSPAFSVLVHYHRFVDGDKGYRMLQLLRNKYLQRVITRTRMELEGLRGKGADPEVFDRIAELDRRMIELEDFREKLERIQEGKDREARIHVRWKSREEQPKGWRPDINDGVKINIAPWERLGMFPVKKIVGKVEMGG